MKGKAYKKALNEGAPQEEIDRLYDEWQESQKKDSEDDIKTPMAYVNGFDHPKLYTLIKEDALKATRFTWGLIPEWTKDKTQADEIRNKTLNARGETMFEKASFKGSVIDKRCLIFVDGFFEYHHVKGKSYPHYIQHVEKEQPLVFGGLWSEWTDHLSGEKHQTATIITTKGNDLMTEIHNNPKLKEARMPVIIQPTDFEQWLTAKQEVDILQLVKPCSNDLLKAYPVKRLIGKNGVGDTTEAVKEHVYPDLFEQGSLF